MIKLYIFIVISLGLIIWSWKSLWNLQVHGFYRFFTFESILALIILNASRWFVNPLSALQIMSWLLLLGSIIEAALGFYLLHTFGKSKKGIEETASLVKTGIYRYIRHPLYGSLILVAWGIFLKNISVLTSCLVISATIFAVCAALIEEKENLQRFGGEYKSYMNSTRRFIPFIV